MKVPALFLLCIASFHIASARVYSRCELAKALLAQGFPRNQLSDWVCLVEAESTRNTSALGGPNKNKTYDFGLFQINSRYWCKIGKISGICNANCNSFLDDNITDDSKCAKQIYKVHKFTAWNGWKDKCQGALPNLSSCGI